MPRSRSSSAFSGAYSPYATRRAPGLSPRTRSITGSASLVAVCIGRKNPTSAAARTASCGNRSFDRSAQVDLDPRGAQPRGRRRQPKRLPTHVVGGKEQDLHETIVFFSPMTAPTAGIAGPTRSRVLRTPARAFHLVLHRDVGAIQLLRIASAPRPLHVGGARRRGLRFRTHSSFVDRRHLRRLRVPGFAPGRLGGGSPARAAARHLLGRPADLVPATSRSAFPPSRPAACPSSWASC